MTDQTPPSRGWEQLQTFCQDEDRPNLHGLNEWDLRMLWEFVESQQAAQITELTNRQGCRCQCCAHSDGSDCGCECHARGLCSSIDFPALVSALSTEVERLKQAVTDTANAADEKDRAWLESFRKVQAERDEARAEVDRLTQENEDSDKVRGMMSDLLRRTAIALKGTPPDGHSWGWADLPDVAQQLRQQGAEPKWK